MRQVLVFLILASSIPPMDLNKLPGQASLVVLGRVTASRVTNDRGFHEKVSTVRVVAVLRGAYREPSLRVWTRTGLVFFDRHLEAGDGGVFFLKVSPRGGFEAAYPGSFALFQEGTFEAEKGGGTPPGQPRVYLTPPPGASPYQPYLVSSSASPRIPLTTPTESFTSNGNARRCPSRSNE